MEDAEAVGMMLLYRKFEVDFAWGRRCYFELKGLELVDAVLAISL